MEIRDENKSHFSYLIGVEDPRSYFESINSPDTRCEERGYEVFADKYSDYCISTFQG